MHEREEDWEKFGREERCSAAGDCGKVRAGAENVIVRLVYCRCAPVFEEARVCCGGLRSWHALRSVRFEWSEEAEARR